MSTEITEYSQTEQALAELRNKYANAVFDVSTTKGMTLAREARAEVRGYRVALEKKRVEIKAPALERCRLIDTEAKRITAALEALEGPIDEIIKAEEHRKEEERLARLEAERQRVQAITAKIDTIRALPASLVGKPSVVIKGQLAKLRDQVPDTGEFAELLPTALDAHTATIARIEQQLQAQLDQEAEQARIKAEREELDRLREADRLRREEDERKAAAERAEQERLDRERREREDAEHRARLEREARERAERETEERRQRETAEADARRIREEEEQARREEQARQRAAEEQRLQAERERLAEEQRQFEARQAEQRKKEAAARAAAEAERLAGLTLRDATLAAVRWFHHNGHELEQVCKDLEAALANDAPAVTTTRTRKKAASA